MHAAEPDPVAGPDLPPDGAGEPETYLVTGPVPLPHPDDHLPRSASGAHAAASDAELARAACSDPRAFAAIYDRYSDRLYDYCARMLRDHHGAADAVQDTFTTVATRLPQLREPDKLRPWLYAIARNEAHRRLKTRRREQLLDEPLERPTDGPGPETHAEQNELAALVAAAALGLPERERTVLELHYRHGLDGPELAAALGLSATNANTITGRARTMIERSLGALLLARRARSGTAETCPELAGILGTWDGAYSVLWRKRIARHIERCPACTATARNMVNPQALLGATPVLLPAPAWLRHEVLHHAGPGLSPTAAGPGTATEAAQPVRSWSRPLRTVRTAPRVLIAASVAVIVAAGVFWFLHLSPAPAAATIARPLPAPYSNDTAPTGPPVTTEAPSGGAPTGSRSGPPSASGSVPAAPREADRPVPRRGTRIAAPVAGAPGRAPGAATEHAAPPGSVGSGSATAHHSGPPAEVSGADNGQTGTDTGSDGQPVG